MTHQTTFRLLFPLTINSPRFDPELRQFAAPKTIVLSFFNTKMNTARPEKSEFAEGQTISLGIPGTSGPATLINVSDEERELVLIGIATYHAHSVMIERELACLDETLSVNETVIRDAVERYLLPISNAIRAVENGWTRNGTTGLFTLETPEIMIPLADKFLPEKWT